MAATGGGSHNREDFAMAHTESATEETDFHTS